MESKAIFFNNKTNEKKQPVKKIISTIKKGATSPKTKESILSGGDLGEAAAKGGDCRSAASFGGEKRIEGTLNNTKVIKSGRPKNPKKNGKEMNGAAAVSTALRPASPRSTSLKPASTTSKFTKGGEGKEAGGASGEIEFGTPECISAPIFSNLEIKLKSPINITKLNEIHSKKTYITELAPSKKISRFKISMIDMNSKLEIEYNEFSIFNYSCFWCRHPFKTLPIGCPVDFIPTSARKKYVSCINNEEYTILENIIDSQKTTDNLVSINDRNYYITDGIFCSFNCCQAYINDNPKTMYKNSSSLLLKIYMYYLDILEEKYEIDSIVITPAPSWRTLICYGGFLSIEEFRSSFNKIIYTLNGKTNAYEYIKNIPIQFRFDENLIF